jgi:hypothetical protein
MIWALFAGKNGGGGRFGRHSGGRSATRAFAGPGGRTWGAEVRVPGASNAMVVFLDPEGVAARNRYAWHVVAGPEARDVTARLIAQQVLDALTDADLARLFRRSMPISSRVPRLEPAVGQSGVGHELDIDAAAEDDVRGVP